MKIPWNANRANRIVVQCELHFLKEKTPPFTPNPSNKTRVIQSSHPVCNTIMLFGVIICLISVILLGIDGRFVSSDEYPKICQARAWLLSTGFTLAYGAMFSKVWRVHRFTTKAKTDPKNGAINFE
ncbi:hypothetical protein GQX74_005629 [Glossina fuscipes]|nr:hypothetical protein GQX74_005629 [Glossina fuscipes]